MWYNYYTYVCIRTRALYVYVHMSLWLQQTFYSLIYSNINSYTKLKLQRPILDVLEYRYTYVYVCMQLRRSPQSPGTFLSLPCVSCMYLLVVLAGSQQRSSYTMFSGKGDVCTYIHTHMCVVVSHNMLHNQLHWALAYTGQSASCTQPFKSCPAPLQAIAVHAPVLECIREVVVNGVDPLCHKPLQVTDYLRYGRARHGAGGAMWADVLHLGPLQDGGLGLFSSGHL